MFAYAMHVVDVGWLRNEAVFAKFGTRGVSLELKEKSSLSLVCRSPFFGGRHLLVFEDNVAKSSGQYSFST